MVALILAAGYGTRMYPLTENVAKALLPVKGKPILEYLLDKIVAPGIPARSIAVVSNHKFAKPLQDWLATLDLKIPWTVLDDGSTSEESRLGAVGDMAFAIQEMDLQEDLLVLGSDNLFEDPLTGFLDFARRKKTVTLGAHSLPDPRLAHLYGVLSVDPQMQIVSFAEKPKVPASSLVSTAVYFLPSASMRSVLKYVSSRKAADTLGAFISWLISQEPVFAYPLQGKWLDIGDIVSYKQAQESFQL